MNARWGAAPIGALVRIYYDGFVSRGDFLQTTTTGRLYLVISVRVQRRGKYLGRRHLACIVASSTSPGAKVRPLRWYPRRG